MHRSVDLVDGRSKKVRLPLRPHLAQILHFKSCSKRFGLISTSSFNPSCIPDICCGSKRKRQKNTKFVYFSFYQTGVFFGVPGTFDPWPFELLKSSTAKVISPHRPPRSDLAGEVPEGFERLRAGLAAPGFEDQGSW